MRRFSTLLALTLLLCAGATAMQALHIASGNAGSLPNSRVGVVNARAVTPGNLAVPHEGVVTNSGDPSAGTFVMQSPGCSYTITQTRAEFDPAGVGSTYHVFVVATDGCPWQAVSNDPTWLTITDGAIGTGDGMVTFQVAANNGPPRAGTLTVAGQQFDVAQGIQGCNYAGRSPAPENFPPGGGTGVVTVSTKSDCSWTVTSLVPWITIRQGSMGTGIGSVDIEVAAHTGASRNGTIAVNGRSLFTVNQSTAAPRNAKTVGVFRPANGVVYLKNTDAGGFDDLNFSYGVSGDTFLAGDWNGDGVDSLGIHRDLFFLRNPNTTGEAERVFPYGLSSDLPLVGDWEGDGFTTIGSYRASTNFFILSHLNRNSPHGDIVFEMTGTTAGDVPIAGDWDGDGITTVGVFRPSNAAFLLRNSNTDGAADISFVYGEAGDLPVVGDWDGDGIDTIGIYRNGVFHLRNSNTTGAADLVFAFGAAGDLPIAGDWDGLP